MLTISRAISAGQALDYYKQEFTNSQDNYYREAGEVKSVGAAAWRRNPWLVSTNDFAVKAAFLFYTK